MNPAWLALAVTAAGIAALAYAAPRARASEQPPRTWAIERCHDGACEVLAWRYSGPTACNVDIASERVAKAQPAGVRLVCVKDGGKR